VKAESQNFQGKWYKEELWSTEPHTTVPETCLAWIGIVSVLPSCCSCSAFLFYDLRIGKMGVRGQTSLLGLQSSAVQQKLRSRMVEWGLLSIRVRSGDTPSQHAELHACAVQDFRIVCWEWLQFGAAGWRVVFLEVRWGVEDTV